MITRLSGIWTTIRRGKPQSRPCGILRLGRERAAIILGRPDGSDMLKHVPIAEVHSIRANYEPRQEDRR